jgi:hypothetical protein
MLLHVAQIDRSLCWFGTGTLKKAAGLNSFMGPNIPSW